ncbi:DUF2164 domain-containing protein [Sporanaerobacter acetigenes]|uniref:Uncharacterized conserved protein, DUF2164 family n=1 Tax=Sporanaerobacter acetigenes DSM 13106 TaxID=1123281 RepID=A0A1M5WFS1_9FIRM|nr:DUF2164 domain-containing protein [Sporanaerobacter acetigenes]SHH86248.1 Uncharacterized conserved protein, DUF2164 family [Sporanaerobacter acetigenes DSM 13106]
MRNKIELNKEKKDEMIRLIKDYFLKERDEDLGDLAAELILDFFVENIAPEFYNQGVYDSYVFIKDKAEDLFAIQR